MLQVGTKPLLNEGFLQFMVSCPSMGQLITQFWTSGDIISGFQSQSLQPYSRLAKAHFFNEVR